jgi:ABC-type multidrug transport system ATPase subunit
VWCRFKKGILGHVEKFETAGITILVSTPYMDEANLCERIALIQMVESASEKPER